MRLRDLLRAARGMPDEPEEDVVDRWLAVGLTNPEGEYGGTRHNVGADVVRHIAAGQSAELKPHKAQALAADTFVTGPGGVRIPLTLAVPFGYMNNSGGPVQALVRFYKLPTDRLIIVHDELDLAPGVLRVKRGGAGGHNGVRDVRQRLSADDFIRLRFGIGRPPGQMPTAAYVLQRFGKTERADVIDPSVVAAAEAVESLITDGLEATQNRVHSS